MTKPLKAIAPTIVQTQQYHEETDYSSHRFITATLPWLTPPNTMSHLSISTHAIIAHNGKIHRAPTGSTTQSPEQTTTIGTPEQTTTVNSSPPGPPRFLGESLLILIIVVPIILWQIRQHGLGL